MNRIEINTKSRSYGVLIGSGLLGSAGEHIEKVAKRALIVADTNVTKLYAKPLLKALAGRVDASTFDFEPGEASKTMDTVDRILRVLSILNFSRTDAVIALGGGVTGDVAGFAAAIYKRGVPLVQIPTTLLAQIDSSVGGKTGVNSYAGKNSVGAFYQPSLVLIDPDTLKTLNSEDIKCGLGEMIKYACIASPGLFDELCENPQGYAGHIACCVDIKRRIVEADERDTGVRMTLNFGHTLAHAIEAGSDYKIAHGVAVGIGMAMTARHGERTGVTSAHTADKIEGLLKKCGMPADFNMKGLFRYVTQDKKIALGKLNLVLLKKIGEAVICPADADELKWIFE